MLAIGASGTGMERLRGRLARRGLAETADTLGAALLPAPLSAAGVKAAAHQAGHAASVTARVAALTEGVLQAMFMTTLKRAVALALLVCCAAVGRGR
jgi:hypothetical protein